MRKIVMLLAFIPVVAMAQTSPIYGCYVDNTGYCSTGHILCGYDYADNLAHHGYTIAEFCQTTLNTILQTEAEITQLQKSASDWQTYGTYQTGVAKKLRRACGTKCRQIK